MQDILGHRLIIVRTSMLDNQSTLFLVQDKIEMKDMISHLCTCGGLLAMGSCSCGGRCPQKSGKARMEYPAIDFVLDAVAA